MTQGSGDQGSGSEIPSDFPPMGAMFTKPYMEFEYRGETYRIDNLVGGHNGAVATACITRPPVWDPERKRWVVPIVNNIIDIDLNRDRPSATSFASGSRFNRMRIVSHPSQRYVSTGLLISATDDPNIRPRFPVDCEFRMHVRVSVPGRPKLFNPKPFRMVASNLTEWPPPVGTRYRNLDEVALVPERLPLVGRRMRPVATIRSGDEAILTEVFVR